MQGLHVQDVAITYVMTVIAAAVIGAVGLVFASWLDKQGKRRQAK